MPKNGFELPNLVDSISPTAIDEMQSRYEEMTELEKNQAQMGTTVPQLYGSLSKFIANPSTVSVETFKRMVETDETISSCVDFLTLAMIARFGEYKHPSKEITDAVNKCLEQMEGSWHNNLAEMFSCEWAGFSTSEMMWAYEKDFCGGPFYRPKRIVTYPPLTIVFAVDRNGQLLPEGIYQYQRYHNTVFNQQFYGLSNSELDGFRPDMLARRGDFPYPIRVAADLSYLTIKMPLHKMIHLTSGGSSNFGSPYGRSRLRGMYKSWVVKDAFLKMWMVAADRKGSPLVVGYADPGLTIETGPKNGQGVAPSTTAAEAMRGVLGNVHNSSFLVFPGMKGEAFDIEAVQTQGDMNVFKDGIDYYNKALMRGLLIPPLAMSAGDGAGSYALGQSHEKIFAKMVDGRSNPHKQVILEQFIKQIIGYNFPKSAWEKDGYGEFSLEEYEPEVMKTLADIYGSMTTSGYMSPSDQVDMDEVRQRLGGLKPKPATPKVEAPSEDGPPISF